MSDRFRISSSLEGRLLSRGVSPSIVLQRAGLPATFFQQEKIHATTAEVFALWRAIGQTSADPAIGLKLGSEPRLEHLSPTAIAAVCSRTFRDAVQRIGRYKQLTCPEEIRLIATKHEVAVEFVYTEATEHEPETLVDLALSWILGIGRRGTDGQVKPLRLELVRPARHSSQYEDHFGCPVRFKARRNALVFNSQDMDRSFVTHNAELLTVIGAQLDLELSEQRGDPDLGSQVKRAVKRSLAGKRPVLQTIAQELGMSERTLQRRLTGIGSTFQHIAEEARRELAHHYLSHSSIEFQEVAYLLGYEDANSFFRAFHTWEGASPGEWRAQQLGTLALSR
jgi:AraC-like DNA-binding protein